MHAAHRIFLIVMPANIATHPAPRSCCPNVSKGHDAAPQLARALPTPAKNAAAMTTHFFTGTCYRNRPRAAMC
jgi:hypothetical protein